MGKISTFSKVRRRITVYGWFRFGSSGRRHVFGMSYAVLDGKLGEFLGSTASTGLVEDGWVNDPGMGFSGSMRTPIATVGIGIGITPPTPIWIGPYHEILLTDYSLNVKGYDKVNTEDSIRNPSSLR